MSEVHRAEEDISREAQDVALKDIRQDVKSLLRENRTSHDALTLTRCNLDHLECLVSGLDFDPLYSQVNELKGLFSEDDDERAV